jgi:DNA-binding NtrC family response regulator
MPSSGCHLPVRMGVFRVFLGAHSGNQVLHSNVRVIAATNVDLENAIKEGRFRQDLYFRLNKIRIHMPRLAERRDDIPLLVAEFIKKQSRAGNGWLFDRRLESAVF